MVCFMALASHLPNAIRQPLIVLGRVPLFFYLAHIVLIHVLAVLLAFLRFGHAEWLCQGPGIFWSEPCLAVHRFMASAWVGLSQSGCL